MKILIMNNYYFPNLIGGAEHSVKLLAEHLVKEDNDVFVLSMDGDEKADITKAEQINGVFVHRSYSKEIYRRRILRNTRYITDKLMNGWHSVCNAKMNNDVKKIIHIIRPDIIHTQNLVAMSYWVWKYAAKKKITVIHTLRDYWLLDPTTNVNQSPRILTVPFRKYHRMLSNRYVAAVTSPSEKTLEIFKKEGFFARSKEKVIVNAINYDEKLLRKCLDEKSNRESNTIGFLFVGNVTENKGIRVLIDAFQRNTLKATLTICGEGDMLSWVKARNDPRILCKGKLTQEELVDEYSRADVLVVPSLWEEPFGRIVIEGAQYGLPIIGSNRGGIPEIIRVLRYGEIFDPEDSEELYKLIEMFSERDYLRQLCKSGPQHLDTYCIDSQVQDFNALYTSLVRRRSE